MTPSLITSMPVPKAGSSIPVLVPGDPALCSIEIAVQVLEQDPGASRGVSFSKGLELTLGS